MQAHRDAMVALAHKYFQRSLNQSAPKWERAANANAWAGVLGALRAFDQVTEDGSQTSLASDGEGKSEGLMPTEQKDPANHPSEDSTESHDGR